MNKIVNRVLIIGIFASFASIIGAQCPEFEIELETQMDVDQFVSSYPNCTSTYGGLTIGSASLVAPSSNITNLNGLSGLTKINGDLIVGHLNSMEYFDGFDNIELISGRLYIQRNQLLKDLHNFGKLDSIGGGLGINGNDNLSTIEGLNSLKFINEYIDVSFNRKLESLEGLEMIYVVRDQLTVQGSPLMRDLKGLENLRQVSSDLTIKQTGLSNLSGLNNLKEIGGLLMLGYNESLLSLDGLESLDTIDNGLFILDNSSLNDCQSICGLILEGYVGGGVNVRNNLLGCNSVQEILNESCMSSVEQQFAAGLSYELFPNPATVQLNILTRFDIQDDIHLKLINSMGVILHNVNYSMHDQDSTMSLDISDLSEGVYFLNVQSNRINETKAFIVNR